jgi:hydroxypyruvate isomerase
MGWGVLPGHEEDFKESFLKAVAYCTLLGCTILHVRCGVLRGGEIGREMTSQELSTLVANLQYACDYVMGSGLRLVIENISTVPGYVFPTTTHALRVIQAVNRPNLGIQLDLYHLQRVEGNVTQWLTTYRQHVFHIQVSSFPARNEPDVPDSELNYNYIFHLLTIHSFSDWVAAEYEPRTTTHAGLRWLQPYTCPPSNL